MLAKLYRWLKPGRSRRRQRGLLLASGGGGGGGSGFTIPTPPTSSTASLVPYFPNFTAVTLTKDPYRPWQHVALDGTPYFCNGWDNNWYWNEASTAYDMGSVAPTTFAVADNAGGSTFTSGTTVRYYLVFRNSTRGKETCPQLTSGVPGTSHTMSATRDIDITWTDPGGEFDKARIYRAPDGTDTYFLVAEVTASTATYTDSTTDATLRTNEPYVTRYRSTKPPAFFTMAAHLNRLWGVPPDSALLYYSQQARIDDENVTDDFKDANILPVNPDDANGDVRAMASHYASLFVWKRRGCYEISGDAPVLSVRKMYDGRGCLAPRCLVTIDNVMIVLDDHGLYLWTPGAEPVTAGSPPNVKESRIQSVFDRMNLDVADTFFAVHDPKDRIVKFYVALDFEPVPNVRIVYDYANNRFVSIDTCVWGCAGGVLEDASGNLHEVRCDDLGYVWEEDYSESEGVSAGSNTATVTSGTGLTLTASAASFDTTVAAGAPGAPLERYDSNGAVLDTNRVYAAGTTALTLLYYSSATVTTSSDTLAIGVIPAVVQTPYLTFKTPEKKWIGSGIIEHESGVSGNLRVDAATNGSTSYSLVKEVSLASNVRTIVPFQNRCWNWSMQLSQRYANLGFTVRGVHVSVLVNEGDKR